MTPKGTPLYTGLGILRQPKSEPNSILPLNFSRVCASGCKTCETVWRLRLFDMVPNGCVCFLLRAPFSGCNAKPRRSATVLPNCFRAGKETCQFLVTHIYVIVEGPGIHLDPEKPQSFVRSLGLETLQNFAPDEKPHHVIRVLGWERCCFRFLPRCKFPWFYHVFTTGGVRKGRCYRKTTFFQNISNKVRVNLE